MKKIIVLGVATTFLLSSCDSYMGNIYAGGSLGSVLGSAVGGIAGGARGSDIGTIVGMAGGAAVGAAIDAMRRKRLKRLPATAMNACNKTKLTDKIRTVSKR